jgi:hypothetical protein
MVKQLALIVAVAATLVAVDAAEARGRRGGCPGGNCYAGGGCPGGNCYVAAGPAKLATADTVTAPLAAEVAPAAVASAPVAAPRYTSNVRRGWFARRR